MVDKKTTLAVYTELTNRLAWAAKLGAAYGGDRDLYSALGYPESITYTEYLQKYQRQDIAKAIIKRPVDTTWKGDISIYDSGDDTDKESTLWKQWDEIYKNTVLSGNLSGNVLGGCLFEWTDEWWKHNEGYRDDWSIHNTEAGWQQSAYFFDIRAKNNLNMNEEWFGIISISPEIGNGINKRLPKKAYYGLKEYFSQISPQP